MLLESPQLEPSCPLSKSSFRTAARGIFSEHKTDCVILEALRTFQQLFVAPKVKFRLPAVALYDLTSTLSSNLVSYLCQLIKLIHTCRSSTWKVLPLDLLPNGSSHLAVHDKNVTSLCGFL